MIGGSLLFNTDLIKLIKSDGSMAHVTQSLADKDIECQGLLFDWIYVSRRPRAIELSGYKPFR